MSSCGRLQTRLASAASAAGTPGDFVVSGRQVLRTGGVILARGERCRIESLIASDPFTIHDVADYRVIEFAPAMAAPGLEALLA